jgi:hypothetical protein
VSDAAISLLMRRLLRAKNAALAMTDIPKIGKRNRYVTDAPCMLAPYTVRNSSEEGA